MPQEQDDKVSRLYRYRLANLELICPDFKGPIDLVPGSVSGLHLVLDYDNNIYPMFSITLMINPKMKEFIIMRKKEVKFHVRLVCLEFDVNKSNIEPVSVTDVFDKMLIPNIGDNIPFADAAIYNQTTEQLKTIAGNGGSVNDLGGNNMAGDYRENVTYYLYDENDLVNSKNVVNKIYTSANIPTVVADLLSSNGFNKILISPPDNGEEIKQLIVQPLNLLNLFDYLTEIYGMYETGVTVFFDYRCVYILNKSGHPKCVEKGEFPKTIFVVKKTTDSQSGTAGTTSSQKKKEYYFYPDSRRIAMTNPSAQNDHIIGNNLTMIDSQENSTAHIEKTGNQKGVGNTRVGNNTNANDYAKTQYANKIQEGNISVQVTLFDALMEALTPNKEFMMQWEDTNVDPNNNGYYRPRKVEHIFNKNGEELTLTSIVDMVKKEDISAQIAAAKDKALDPSTAQYIDSLGVGVGKLGPKNVNGAVAAAVSNAISNALSNIKIPGVDIKIPGL